MDVLKSFGWDSKLGDWGYHVPLNFCLLAGNALSCPLTDILFDIRPDELVCDGLTGAFNPWMAKAMYHIENAASV